MPLPLGLPHLGNIVANMFANPYPIVETVYLLKGPHVPNKSRLQEVSLLVSFARKSVKELRYGYASGRRVVRSPVRAAKYSHITFRTNERLLAV